MITVQKRNGDVVPFLYEKIEHAITKAAQAVAKPLDPSPLVDAVTDAIRPYTIPVSVETIQDAVERALLAQGHRDVARAYMAFRDEKAAMRRRRPISAAARAAFDEAATYFPTQLQQFQFFDKYSRFNYALGRRETWVETVDRAIDFLIELTEATTGQQRDEVVKWLRGDGREMMLRMEALPSMRLLAMAGEPARRQNLALYNCSCIVVDDPQAWVEMLIISMSGCGVGFGVERKYIDKLPSVAVQTGRVVDHVAADSTEGWAEALRLGLECWFGGGDVRYDFSQVRPAGAPLKTKGGRASGPEPLRLMLAAIRDIILSRRGQRLRDTDAHTISCHVGQAAVQGGMRRTAMISLSDADSTDMARIKQGNYDPVLWNANNSSVWHDGVDDLTILRHFVEMDEGKNGERGIFSRDAAMATMPERRRALWPQGVDAGTNPCQAGFATVLTPDGIRTFDDIEVGSIIWSGRQWTRVVNKISTGVKPVFEYRTTAGVFIGTENHRIIERGRKIEVGAAQTVDTVTGPAAPPSSESWDKLAMLDGWVIGDGTVHKASNNKVFLVIGKKDGEIFEALGDLIGRHRPGVNPLYYEMATTIKAEELPLTFHRSIPTRFKQSHGILLRSFLRGLYSANGSVCGDRVTLKAASLAVIRDVQQMLSALGMVSYITTNKAHEVQFANGTYTCKQSYDLNITKDRSLFRDLIGFVQKDKTQRLDSICELAARRRGDAKPKKTWEIQEVRALGEMPVYDITVDAPEHTYWTGGLLVSNCGEIVLRSSGQLCNLSIAVARADDTTASLSRKVKAAAIFGTVQSTATNFPGLRPVWKENCEAERLLGVDINGQLDCPLFSDFAYVVRENYAHFQHAAVEQNRETAAALGINASTAVTCVKPSGNSSTLLDCSPGLHPRHAAFYIRNVRVSSHSPVYKVLRDAGAPLSPENGQTAETATTWVCSFPCKAPQGAIVKADETAMHQLERWLLCKRWYTEHNPSVTITYKPQELVEVVAWVAKHRDIVGGLSFLPYSGAAYEQMPYIEIGEAEYTARAAAFPVIDWSKLTYYEDSDLTTAAQELACAAGACLI